MRLTRLYEAKDINWVLVPDLLEKVGLEIVRELEDERSIMKTKNWWFLNTVSERVNVASAEDFLSLLHNVEGPISEIRASLAVYVGGYREPQESLFDCQLVSSNDGVQLEFRRPNIGAALALRKRFEDSLQLKPYRPLLNEGQALPRRRTVFIAHAFDDVGRSYAYQLRRFLELLGFEIATGEGFSPERVSAKVKRRLLSQEIVIVVVSENTNLTWLIQEAVGADFSKRPLILLVQDGVEFKPGLLGDLEYIRFPAQQISESFMPLLEGLREIGFSFA